MKPCLVVLLVCLLLLGCGPRRAELTPDDQAILRTVLKHFATADTGTATNSTLVYVDNLTMVGTAWISDAQLDCELNPRGCTLGSDLRRSLRRRSRTPVSLADFDFPDMSICVTNKRPDFEYSYSNRVTDFTPRISFWMPGYSKDGQTAVVRFAYGPLTASSHPANGTYNLLKANNDWRVDWALFLEFP